MSYEITEVPPTGTNATRYALPITPAGWSAEPCETLAICLNKLAAARIQEAPELLPDRVTVALKRVAITTAGEYVLVDRGNIVGTPTRVPRRLGKFKKERASGGALIDALFLGEQDAWESRDETIWEALREMCAHVRAKGRTLRRLNDETARIVALRCGLEVDPGKLPS
jgi:hypothetical protein